MDRSPVVSFLFLALALSSVSLLSATTVESRTGGELIENASLIAIGNCTAVASEWWQGALATRYSIAISETLKGEASNEINLYIPGGIDLDREVPIAVTVPGAPILLPNEEVLLFLDPLEDGPAGYSVVGFSQGLFHIRREDSGAGYLQQGLENPLGTTLEQARRDILQHLGQTAQGGKS
ncbi:MAG: hypothetical protein K0U98_13105 [Deltaproteobacteria bacterium]|nr:hypothetical protein [Deltaproteobacteria bacterium]